MAAKQSGEQILSSTFLEDSRHFAADNRKRQELLLYHNLPGVSAAWVVGCGKRLALGLGAIWASLVCWCWYSGACVLEFIC